MDERQLHVLALQLAQAFRHRLERPLDVGLDHQVEGGRLAALDLLEDVLELGSPARRRCAPAQVGAAEALLALLGDVACRPAVGHASQLVARRGQRVEAEHLCRERRRRLFDVVALVVDQGLDTAPGRAGHDVVADPEGAVLHDDGGHRPLPGVEVGFEHDAASASLGVGPQLLDLGHDHQLLEQVVDAEVLQGGHLDHDRVAAPLLGDQAQLGELLHDAVGVRRRRGRSC